MSPPGRPKGEYRSAEHEGSSITPPGRPKGEYRSAEHEGPSITPPGRPKGLLGAIRPAALAQPVPRPPLRGTRRVMNTRDIDAVLAIEVQAYSFPWSRGNFIDSLAAGYSAEVLHLLDHGQVVLAGYFVAMPGVDELHLLNITVAPDWQGQGLGLALLQAVQSLGQQRGLAQLLLEVRASNQRALSLYRQFGFAAIGQRPGYYPAAGGREDAIVMRLGLQAHGAA